MLWQIADYPIPDVSHGLPVPDLSTFLVIKLIHVLFFCGSEKPTDNRSSYIKLMLNLVPFNIVIYLLMAGLSGS